MTVGTGLRLHKGTDAVAEQFRQGTEGGEDGALDEQ
jgi:hypothetical protein